MVNADKSILLRPIQGRVGCVADRQRRVTQGQWGVAERSKAFGGTHNRGAKPAYSS